MLWDGLQCDASALGADVRSCYSDTIPGHILDTVLLHDKKCADRERGLAW